MDVKTIGIEVQQKGVVSTTNSLSRLTTVAQNLVKPVQGAVEALEAFHGLDLTPVANQFKNVSQGVKDTNTALSGITASSSGIKSLSLQFTSIANAAERMGTAVPGLSSFATQLERIKSTLESMQGMGAALTSVRRAAEGNIPTSSGARSSSSSSGGVDKEATAQRQLMQQLERQTMMIEGKTKAGYLELRAAQLGVADAAAPFIAKMKAAETGMNGVGMSAKQTAWAMKMVPAQMTDIVTQLAGGQSPFLVAIQQGGQMRDMFQGFGNMFKNVGGMILKFLLNPFVLVGGALAVLAYGFVTGALEIQRYNKALILTSSYIGLTSSQMLELSRSIKSTTVSQTDAINVLTQMATAGIKANDSTGALATTISNFSKYSGQAIEDVVKLYASLQKDPVQALNTLNETTHAISASTLAYVESLIKQGNTLEATRVATEAVKNSQDEMSKGLIANAGLVQKAWLDVKDAFANLWDNIKNIGRGDPLGEQINKAQQHIKQLQQANAGLSANGGGGLLGKGVEWWNNFQIGKEQKTVSTLTPKLAAENKTNSANNLARDQDDAIRTALSGLDSMSGKQSKVLHDQTELIKLKQKEATITNALVITEAQRAAGVKGGLTLAQKAVALKEIAARRADIAEDMKPKEKGAGAGTGAIASAMADLQKQKQLNLQLTSGTYTSTEKMTEEQKKLIEQENVITLSKQKGNNVTAQQVALASKLIPIYREAARLSLENQKLMDDNKQVERSKQKNEEGKLALESLKEEYAYLVKTKAISDSRSSAEKEANKQQALAKLTHNEASKLVFQTTANTYIAIAAQDKLNKKVEEENKALRTTTKMRTDYNLEVQAAEEAEANNLAWMHLSSVEQEKKNALQSIEVTRRKEIADLEDKISQAYAEQNPGLAEQLKLQEDIVNARARGLSKVVESKPTLQSKEGTSWKDDAQAGYTNFYNGLESRTSLMQSAFSTAFSTMSDSLSTFCNTGKLDFKSFTVSILKGIQEMIIKFTLLKLAQMAVGMLTSAASTGSSPSAGVGVGDYSSLGMWGGSGVTASGSASGNVFGTMTNQVYSRATPFKFAKGGSFGNQGVLGEAGPEAVVPLARTSNGELGVKTTGGNKQSSASDISITVNVASDGTSDTSSTGKDADKKLLGEALAAKIRSVIVEEMRPNGILTKAA